MHVKDVLFITELPPDCIAACGHPGPCDDDVAFWRKELDLTVDRERAVSCLQGYGAWDADELAALSNDDIAEKILWLACNDFSEFIAYAERAGVDPFRERADDFDPPAGSDIFVLE